MTLARQEAEIAQRCAVAMNSVQKRTTNSSHKDNIEDIGPDHASKIMHSHYYSNVRGLNLMADTQKILTDTAEEFRNGSSIGNLSDENASFMRRFLRPKQLIGLLFESKGTVFDRERQVEVAKQFDLMAAAYSDLISPLCALIDVVEQFYAVENHRRHKLTILMRVCTRSSRAHYMLMVISANIRP